MSLLGERQSLEAIGAQAPQWGGFSAAAPAVNSRQAGRDLSDSCDYTTLSRDAPRSLPWHGACVQKALAESRMSLSVSQFDLLGERVLLRADFNVPLTGDESADEVPVRVPAENVSSQPGIAAGQMRPEV